MNMATLIMSMDAAIKSITATAMMTSDSEFHSSAAYQYQWENGIGVVLYVVIWKIIFLHYLNYEAIPCSSSMCL